MAHVQGHKRRKMQQVIPGSVGKENRAPSKAKQTVSINGMFEHAKAKRQPYEERGLFSPKLSAVPKATAKPGYFARLTKSKSQAVEPDYFAKRDQSRSRGFGNVDAIRVYQDAVDSSFEQQMAQWRKEIDLRKDGFDAHGKQLKAPVPTREQIEGLKKQLDDICKPIEDKMLDIQDTQGSVRTQRVGDTMDMLKSREETKRAHIEALEAEAQGIDEEIAMLEKALFDDDDEEIQKAKEHYNVKHAALQKEMEKIEAQAESQIDEMKHAAREAKKAFNQKIQALWEGMDDGG